MPKYRCAGRLTPPTSSVPTVSQCPHPPFGRAANVPACLGLSLGRYLQPDPIGLRGGANSYNYAGANSIRRVDRRGLCAEDLCIVEGIVAVEVWEFITAVVGAAETTTAVAAATEGTGDEPKSEDKPELLNPIGRGNAGKATDEGENSCPVPNDKPSLVDDERKIHILDGDETGGGHRAGTGNPGKSEFPADWSDDKILGEISDVATDPNSDVTPGRGGKQVIRGTRDGVDIEIIYDPQKGRIITAYPTNVPRNP